MCCGFHQQPLSSLIYINCTFTATNLSMISGKNIHKSYGSLEVLKGIDLLINKGEIVSIVGASGAGKTTLLQIIGTLDRPTSGSIEFDNPGCGKTQ
jgi:lipoprotein-releasing system ATP-binding protein